MVEHLLFQFCKSLGNILLVCKSDHDVQFLKLDIDGVIVLNKEHFHLILQNIRSAEEKKALE